MKALVLLVAAALLPTASFAGEKAAPLTIEQAEARIAAGVQILDVRTQSEWNEGHLKGAKFVTVSGEGFLQRAKAVLDPKKPVLAYCRSGGRSAKAAIQLREAGFVVHDLAGGITAWLKAGKPVVK